MDRAIKGAIVKELKQKLHGIDSVLRRLVQDEEFRTAFKASREKVLAEADLSAQEREALQMLDPDVLVESSAIASPDMAAIGSIYL